MGTTLGGGPRVLLVHPGAELYGSDRVLLEAATDFAEAGWHARVVIPNDGPLAHRLVEQGIEVKILDSFVLRKALMKPRGWGELLCGVTLGRGVIRRTITDFAPDLVYVSTVIQPLWAPVARSLRIPVIMHVHEAESNAHSLVRKVIYRTACSATRVYVPSSFARDVLLQSYPQLEGNSRVLVNPVAAPADPVPPRAEITGPLRVGYVGRLSPRKGVSALVDAVGSLVADGHDVTLDLVGAVFSGMEWFEAELHDQVARLGLGERVRFLGFQPAVWDAIAACDVAVVPSLLPESFGNTAVEIVLARRPVIVSDIGALPEAVTGVPTAVIVPPDSAAALAQALSDIRERWADIVDHSQDAADILCERHDVARFRKRLVTDAASLVSAAAR